MKRTVGLLIIVLSIVLTVGCSKKEEPAKAPSAPAPDQQQAAKAMEQASQTAKDTVQAARVTVASKAEEIKQVFTSEVNLDKSITDLKAEAEKMDMASLMQVAAKYKDAIVAKQGDLKTLSEKLAALPMTEKLGTQGQQLTADAQKLTEAIKSLKDRFEVYLTAVKAKGGDAASLAI